MAKLLKVAETFKNCTFGSNLKVMNLINKNKKEFLGPNIMNMNVFRVTQKYRSHSEEISSYFGKNHKFSTEFGTSQKNCKRVPKIMKIFKTVTSR